MNNEIAPISNQGDISQRVLALGRGVPEETMVIGSAAVYAALPGARLPHDIDLLCTTPEVFGHLREAPDMRHTHFADGSPRLIGKGFDIGIVWQGYTPGATAHERKWQDGEGVNYAGLTDLYPSKQERNNRHSNPKDRGDMAFIRQALQDPDSDLLPESIMQSEMTLLLASLPEHLHGNPDILRVIAENVYTDFTLYGDPRIRRANQIIGTLEKPRYHVPALYHNGFGLLDELGAMAGRMAHAGFSLEDQQDGLLAHSAADNIYGNGRISNNRAAYDELLSSLRLEGRVSRIGFGYERIMRVGFALLATEFVEGRTWQRGRDLDDPVAREVAGRDLHVLSEPSALKSIWGLVFEDGFSARFDERRTLGRVAVAEKFYATNVTEAVQFFGDKLDVRVRGSDQSPREYIGRRLIGNAWFHKNYEQPWDYPTHDMVRYLHAERQEWLGRALLAGRMALAEVHEAIEEHTRMMQNMFGVAA